MDLLAEPRAVALLLEHKKGWVHVFSDGSSLWSDALPDPGRYWDPADVPEAIVCQKRTYEQARGAFAGAVRRLRARGITVS
jgi:hypothetical protein